MQRGVENSPAKQSMPWERAMTATTMTMMMMTATMTMAITGPVPATVELLIRGPGVYTSCSKSVA